MVRFRYQQILYETLQSADIIYTVKGCREQACSGGGGRGNDAPVDTSVSSVGERSIKCSTFTAAPL